MSNPRVALHNRCKGRANIEYNTSKRGPDHQPTFACQVQINGTTWGQGTGGTKKEAEEVAASNALAYGDETGAFNAL